MLGPVFYKPYANGGNFNLFMRARATPHPEIAIHNIPAYCPAFTSFPPLLPGSSLSFGKGAMDVPFMAERSIVTYFKHLEEM